MNEIHEKYRHVLADVPGDSILGVQVGKQQPDDLGLMDKRLPPLPSREAMITAMVTVLNENPWMANTDKNGVLLAEWINKNRLVFNLTNMRGAVKVLRNELEKAKPAPPPPPAAPPAPVEPVEVLEPGQLSINASTWEMKNATPAQLHDLIRRQQQAKRKKS